MDALESVTGVFADFQSYFNKEQDLREEIRSTVRELEQTAREIHAILQRVHQKDGSQNVVEICKSTEPYFETARKQFQELSAKIPENQYYRFNDHWKYALQKLSFLSALVTYLKTEKLVSREETAAMIGVKLQQKDGFHMDLDDYLIGLLQMASELSRLAVNSVTAGDFHRPMRISKFVAELDAGFRLLNLKNDTLRKRFDGLKYDLKKVEEVVYDLTIRGLKPVEET
ncbi:translin-like [Crassostrea virginica]|uniref:Translin n=1 Tax=Crassostrea virginica TaxID=6565 RepID=A0A8B8ETC9_CRAVI|nr:translin-like [Crassostrea virginica]